MRPNADQIQENWSELNKVIETHFTGERLEKIKLLHKHFEERMIMAPASGRDLVSQRISRRLRSAHS